MATTRGAVAAEECEEATEQSYLLRGGNDELGSNARARFRSCVGMVVRWVIPASIPLIVSFLAIFAELRQNAAIAAVNSPIIASGGLKFMVIGDWGREGQYGQKDVADAMAKVARQVAPQFIISAGDNFYDEGVKSVHDSMWKTSFEDVYSDASLQNIAWWSVLGNHDYLGNIDAQMHYSGKSRRWTMPAPYYTFATLGEDEAHKAEVQFIFLDSTPFIHDGYGKAARKLHKQKYSRQVTWLKETLENSTARFLVIVLHHNMYALSTKGHLGASELRGHIEPLLLRYRERVLAVISGHEHMLLHMQPYGAVGAWAGAASVASHDRSSRPLFGRESGTIDHFISGGGSALDKLKLPDSSYAGVWEACCGVLSMTNLTNRPRGVWGESSRGFFVFSITKTKFQAVAYNEKASVIYSYEKNI